MLRLTELALLLVPFAAFAFWRLAGGGVPSAGLLGGAAAAMLLLAAALIWFANHETLGPGQRYVPAHVENGQVLPGHAAGP